MTATLPNMPASADQDCASDCLLRRVADGQSGAVEMVMRKYSGLVWSLARRFCGDASEAEDASQEIFLDVWKSAGRFDPGAGSESTFVMMIARRRLIDRRRRQNARLRPQHLEQPESISTEDNTGEAEISDESRLVLETMGELRPEQRSVLELSLMEGKSHQQIASTTGLPLGTVKSHARRGLQRLRESLRRRQGGAE